MNNNDIKIGDLVEQRVEITPNIALKTIGSVSKIKNTKHGKIAILTDRNNKIIGEFNLNELKRR